MHKADKTPVNLEKRKINKIQLRIYRKRGRERVGERRESGERGGEGRDVGVGGERGGREYIN